MAKVFMAASAFFALSRTASGFNLSVTLPEFSLDTESAQVCTSIRVPRGTTYLTGLKPLGRYDKLHHMAVFACTEPGYHSKNYHHTVPDPGDPFIESSYYWTCFDGPIEGLPHGSLCPGRGKQRIFGWDYSPSEYSFPEGVGFEVGQNTRLEYFVFALHYHTKPEPNDNIGFELFLSEKVEQNLGVFTIYTPRFSVPPRSTANVECIWRMDADIDINVFGFHPHTHLLGRMVSGYKIDSGGKWTLIGAAKPRNQEIIHPAEEGTELSQSDLVAFMCTMENNYNQTVSKGDKTEDEMCIYILYFTYAPCTPMTSSVYNMPMEYPCLESNLAAKALSQSDFQSVFSASLHVKK